MGMQMGKAGGIIYVRWWEGGAKMGGIGGVRGERWDKMWREVRLKIGGR
jgi:hypothetical protein